VQGRSRALDGWRGVAILLVVAFHWLGFRPGAAGVDLFFVLSGYLIGGILIDQKQSENYFRVFYCRRAVRILPLYLLFLVIVIPFSNTTLAFWQYLVFAQNIGQALIGSRGDFPELTWSLAVEEQFYLMIPLLIRFAPVSSIISTCVILGMLTPLVRIIVLLSFQHAWAAYVLLPCRMDALLGGVLVAAWVRQPGLLAELRRRVMAIWLASGLAAAGAVAVSLDRSALYTITYHSWLAVACGAALLAIAVSGWQPSRLSPLGPIGLGAYSAYLFHRPIFAAVGSLTGASGLPLVLVASVSTCIVSVCCWQLIELPCINWARHRWRYRPGPRQDPAADDVSNGRRPPLTAA
jgi:peptidoglycan/LPS O-acetylase OafA/YrhL